MNKTTWALAVWRGSEVLVRVAVKAPDTMDQPKIAAHLVGKVEWDKLSDWDAYTVVKSMVHREEK